MSTNLLTSPKGTIHFMAAANPVKSANDKMLYTVRIAFDNVKDKDWLDQVSKINDTKVVTAETYRGKSDATRAILKTGKSLISSTSQFKPIVYDSKGNEMEEAPMFFSDSTGIAQMIVQPYKGEKGGTINLIGIIIHELDTPDNGTGDRETRLAQLRAAVEQATK